MLNLGPDPIPQPRPAREEKQQTVKKQSLTRPTPNPPDAEVIAKATAKIFTYEESNLNDTIHTILQCLSNVSAKRYYGISVLADILRGANSQRIKTAGLDLIPEYGALKHVRREVVVNIIDWLIEQKFILKTKGAYPVLHPTYNGMHYAETIVFVFHQIKAVWCMSFKSFQRRLFWWIIRLFFCIRYRKPLLFYIKTPPQISASYRHIRTPAHPPTLYYPQEKKPKLAVMP